MLQDQQMTAAPPPQPPQLPATAPEPADGPEPGAAEQPQQEWFHQWYPVMPVVDLDPSRPLAFTLLGMPLALWCDAAGDWHAVADRCLHRLAPLSEGRVENGELMCSYHGWRFNGDGSCTHVPQIGDARAQASACSSPRAGVASFPTNIAHDLLWVYGSSSPEAWRAALVSATLPAAVSPQMPVDAVVPPGGQIHSTKWFFRDLALRYDTLTENLLDPSHVQFAHHGVLGSRNSPAVLEVTACTAVTPAGFTATVSSSRTPGLQFAVSFSPPCTARYDFPTQSVLVYMYPTKEGWTRTAGRTTAWGVPRAGLRPAFDRFRAECAEVDHPRMRHPILDGDTYMLHLAERKVAQAAPARATSLYFQPAKADGTVVAWHKWITRFGGQVPTCEAGVAMPPALPRREVLDRYAHTKECKACSRALKAVDVATLVAAAVAGLGGLLLLVRCFAAGQPPLLATSTVALAALVAAAGAVAAKLRQLRNVYIFTDWVHADHN